MASHLRTVWVWCSNYLIENIQHWKTSLLQFIRLSMKVEVYFCTRCFNLAALIVVKIVGWSFLSPKLKGLFTIFPPTAYRNVQRVCWKWKFRVKVETHVQLHILCESLVWRYVWSTQKCCCIQYFTCKKFLLERVPNFKTTTNKLYLWDILIAFPILAE